MSQLNPTRILCSCTRCSSPRGLTYRARRANLTCCWTLKVFIFKGDTPHGNGPHSLLDLYLLLHSHFIFTTVLHFSYYT